MVNTLKNTDELDSLIKILKSESGVSGYRLRNAHIKAGRMLGELISTKEGLLGLRVGIIVMLKSGLFLAAGVAEGLEVKGCKVDLILSTDSNIDLKSYDKVIIADGVINTGSTIRSFINILKLKDPIIAVSVLPKDMVEKLNDLNVYSCRLSAHSYVGSSNKEINNGRGPATSYRLFSSEFYK